MSNPESGFRFEALEVSHNPESLRQRATKAVLRARIGAAFLLAATAMPSREVTPEIGAQSTVSSNSGPDPLKVPESLPKPVK